MPHASLSQLRVSLLSLPVVLVWYQGFEAIHQTRKVAAHMKDIVHASLSH